MSNLVEICDLNTKRVAVVGINSIAAIVPVNDPDAPTEYVIQFSPPLRDRRAGTGPWEPRIRPYDLDRILSKDKYGK